MRRREVIEWLTSAKAEPAIGGLTPIYLDFNASTPIVAEAAVEGIVLDCGRRKPQLTPSARRTKRRETGNREQVGDEG